MKELPVESPKEHTPENQHAEDVSHAKLARPTHKKASDRLLHYLELYVVALIAMVLGAAGARVVHNENVGINLTIPAQPPISISRGPQEIVGIAFFENGSPRLDQFSIRNIARWARALNACANAEILVRGSTSSVPYRKSKKTNVNLANERSESVVGILGINGFRQAKIQEVYTNDDLNTNRMLDDHIKGIRQKNIEAVDRRVDLILVNTGECHLETPTSKAP
jgi:outer membrane protein OmpA-like peptidoglycan-associated protein